MWANITLSESTKDLAVLFISCCLESIINLFTSFIVSIENSGVSISFMAFKIAVFIPSNISVAAFEA